MPPTISDNAPDSLLDQCFVFVVRNLSTISHINRETSCYELFTGLALPRELCEKLIYFYNQNVGVLDDRFISLFNDTSVTSLKRVSLRDSGVTDNGFATLASHNLVELSLEKCSYITQKSLSNLNKHGDNLTSLSVGAEVKLLPKKLRSAQLSEDNEVAVIKAPKLRQLIVRNLMLDVKDPVYFNTLFQSLPNLTHLDISGYVEIEDFTFLTYLKNLTSLVLYNVMKVQDGLTKICELKKLRHLDISQSNDKIRTFDQEHETLAYIVKNLPALVSLDISGTNLAGTGVANGSYDSGALTDIPGLNDRANNPLDFLGLYGTQHGACRRHDIPAKLISGDNDEQQILIASSAYMNRPEILQRVLNDLYHLFRFDHCEKISQALNLVLEAMERHISDKHIQISCSATLFYIVKNKESPPISAKVKRKVISTLLNGMSNHRDDDTMMRNGCLTLCQFKIPQDVLFEYEKLVLMLLHIVSDMQQEGGGFVQRIGIYLLNSLACQVDNSQKQLLGDLFAIDKMLKLINDRVSRNVCDDVLEVAWSTMWNVTDETAINCERFLDGGGMDLFLKCLNLFPEKEELMRNMMGLLGNVAEVKHLRSRLMVRRYIEVFSELVNSVSDGIEVSYNAAGVLSHLASDGEEAWKEECPPRSTVLSKMVQEIDSWSLDTERNINYRSFEPILQLARVRHTPECQHWAVWALANLTKVYPDKYCSLVEAENGIEVLEELISEDTSYDKTKELALKVLDQCRKWKEASQEDVPPEMRTPELDG